MRLRAGHALTPLGQFSASGAPSGTVDCLQGNLCWALIELGCDDPRLEGAFEWMARSVTGEGIAPNSEARRPVRYYAGKCGPLIACGSNNKLPCAWGAAKVMLAFGKWPIERRTPVIERAIQQGVEFLLGVDPASAAYPSGWTDNRAATGGSSASRCSTSPTCCKSWRRWSCWAAVGDPRLANALKLVHDKQDAQGRWALEYDYAGKTWVDFGPKKQPNKWVTLRACAP